MKDDAEAEVIEWVAYSITDHHDWFLIACPIKDMVFFSRMRRNASRSLIQHFPTLVGMNRPLQSEGLFYWQYAAMICVLRCHAIG